MKTSLNANHIIAFLLALLMSIITFYCGTKSGNYTTTSTVQDQIKNSCITGSQVTLQNYVFTCQLKGEKISVTLPSGKKTTIYKAYEQESP